MSSFGPALRDARQGQGISLDEVARDTRLSKRYLLALEEESLSELPGGAYNRGYVRTYALYLRLDADSLVRDYAREEEAQTQAGRLAVGSDVLTTMRQAAERRRSQPAPIGSGVPTVARVGGLACLAVALLVGLTWVRTRGFTRRDEPFPIATSIPPSRGVSGGVSDVSRGVGDEAADRNEAKPRPHRLEQGTTGPGVVRLPRGDVFAPEVGHAAAPEEGHAAAPRLSVTSSGVGTDVIDQQLVGRSGTFAVGTRVAFWTHVTGGRPGDTVRHVWSHDGRTAGAVVLPVRGSSWRTQSRRTLAAGAEGDWVVEARDPEGNVLARHEFRCAP
jgi:transcriptional regulator with XRE-family HTH domain